MNNDRRWRSIDENRDRKNAHYRARSRARTVDQKAKRAAQKRAWRAANPDRVAKQKRQFLLRRGKARQHYLRYQNRYNRRRARAKRAYMLARYYAEHPVRPDPHCAGCKERIAWAPLPNGRAGAPPKWCDRCCTPAEGRRRERRRAAIEASRRAHGGECRMRRRRTSCGHGPRGVCDDCRRRQNAAYARRKRERALAADMVAKTRCPKKHGSGACNGPLETTTDSLGRTVVTCAWCDRQARGICRDCSLPVAGRVGYALRCADHKRLAQRAQVRAHRERNLEAIREYQRMHRLKPDVRTRDLEYKRLWRKANREKIRAQKRRAALRQPKRVYRYQERYRAKFSAYVRDQRRKYYRLRHPVPTPGPCRKCGGPVQWNSTPGALAGRPPLDCDTCVFPCVRRLREAARARIAERVAAYQAVEAERAAQVRRIRVPKRRKYAETGERLCISDGCTAPVTGRTKKCRACKERERQAARMALNARVAGQEQGRAA